MHRQIALLRGVNLGRHNRLGTARLRQLLDELGYSAVRTHLQSGNAVFDAPTPPDETASRIGVELADQLGLHVPVLVRTAEELAAIVALDPLGAVATDPSRYLVQFLHAEPDPDPLAALDPADYEPERYAVAGREIYLWLPNGVHAATLTARLSALGVSATGRNWRTVLRLLALAQD